MFYNVLSEMNSTDVAGVPVALNTIVTDNLISYVESYNPNLGKAGDDYYQRFNDFLSNVQNREYEIININDIAQNEYKAYDLNQEDIITSIARTIADFIYIASGRIKYNYAIQEKNHIIDPSNNRSYIRDPHKYTIKDYMKNKNK